MTNILPRKHTELSEFREDASLVRELPYWDIIDDTMILADGTLAAGYLLTGIAIETWDADEINRLASDLRAFLNGIPDEVEVTFISDVNAGNDALISQHEALKGKNPEAAWIAGERVARLMAANRDERLLKPKLYLVVYRRKSPISAGKRSNLIQRFFHPPATFQSETKAEFDARASTLRQTAEGIIGGLCGLGIKAAPVDDAAMCSVIYRFLNPSRATEHPPPKISDAHRTQEFTPEELAVEPGLSLPSPREQLCFSDLILDMETFLLGSYHHRIITLKALPEFTHAGMMAKLSGLPFHHMISVHVKVPPQTEELSRLQARRRMAHSMSLSQGGRATDLESEARLHATEDLLRELLATGQKIFYAQIAILIRAKNISDLTVMTNTVLSRMRELGSAEGLAESVAAFKTWKTMLPLGNIAMIRQKRIKTDNLADLLPIYEGFRGTDDAKPVCLFENRSGGLVAHDPFHPGFPNYNALVTGSSGAGKSFLNNLVLFQYMTERPMVFVIDIGGSYRKLCEFFGGEYIDITPPKDGETVKPINPFALPCGSREPSPQKLKFLLALLENILAGDDGERLGKLDRALLEEMVIKTYDDAAGKNEDPTLSHLSRLLAASPEPSLKAFARMLYPWTGARPYGRLLDARS